MYNIICLKKLCYKLISTDKSIKRAEIKSIDIKLFIKLVNLNEKILINLLILQGLVKIYLKQNKYLLDDSTNLLSLLSVNKTNKTLKHPKIIEKAPEDSYISDVMLTSGGIDMDDFSMEPIRETISNKEVTEHSSLMESFKIGIPKRRKVEDDIIEYDSAFYRNNICNIKNIIENSKRFNFNCNLEFKNIFSDKFNFVNEPEVMRDQTTIDHYNEISIDDGFSCPSLPISDVCDESKMKVEDLPSCFVFEEYVKDFGRNEQAECFYSLLNLASQQLIDVKQESPISPIYCNLIS